MKKYTLYLLAIFSFFLFSSNALAYSFEGHYECYRGGTLLNRSNFSVDGGKDLNWRCNSGYTNVNFYFEAVNIGVGAINGDRGSFSFVPSSPLGISSGADLQNLNSKCLVSQSSVVCPSTYQNQFGFVLYGDGGYYWHIMKSFNFADSEEDAALSNYQSSLSMNESTNSAINNSTNSIINNQNSQFNDIKKQTEELKQQQEEQNETSKGIWGTIKEIFSSIVSLPVKIFNGIKSIFLPDPICYTNLLNIYSNYSAGDVVSRYGVDFKFNDDGSITINGTATADADLALFGKWNNTSQFITLEHDFTASIFNNTVSLFYLVDGTNTLISTSSSSFVKVNEPKRVSYIMLRVPKNTTLDNVTIYPQIAYAENPSEFTQYGVEVCTGGSFGSWFENVVSGIGNFFSNLTNSIAQFFRDLLTGILDGLKTLFVPTDEQLYEIINDSKDLAENFGFVGESINFFINIFTSLLGMINANGCVELPEFSIGPTSMFEKITFWNSQNVCLADNVILSTHIDTIRTVTSIVLVCLFIGFAAAKFFNILSKNESNQASMDAYDLRDRR